MVGNENYFETAKKQLTEVNAILFFIYGFYSVISENDD